MSQVFLSTTGTVDPVVIAGFEISHPTTDLPLISPDGFLTYSELISDTSFTDHVTAGEITLEDSEGNSITTFEELTEKGAPVSSGGGSRYYDYMENSELKTTTSKSGISYVSKKVTVPKDGLYKITWNALISNTSAGWMSIGYKVLLGNTLLTKPGGDGKVPMRLYDLHQPWKERGLPIAGARTLSLTAGTYDLDFQVYRPVKSGTVHAQYALVDILEV